jgi:transposase InsO family protein
MLERQQFLNEFTLPGANRSEVCARYGISRRVGYKWLRRLESEGLEGLADRSHAPLNCPHAMSEELRELLSAARRKHRTWGPKKLLKWVHACHPKLELPAASTVGAFLKRSGFVAPRTRKRRIRAVASPCNPALLPNQVWCADFKGDFKLGNGQRCYPLTITDLASRKILACVALAGTTTEGAREVFQRAFRRYGLPESIRTDNGIPFATTNGMAGVSVLNVWWLRLGIRHERIDLGHPEQNGAHERMHRTLKEEAVFPVLGTMRAQQRRFDRFRRTFNHVRPHEALGQLTPDSAYRRSVRELPRTIAELKYPTHMEARTVSARGMVSLDGREVWVSEALHHQRVGLEQLGWRRWLLYVGPLCVAEIDPNFQVVSPTEALLRRAG